VPHLIIEHSADAAPNAALLDAVFQALAAHPAIPKPETLKLRCTPCGLHMLGTKGQSFAHATLLLLPGRDGATKSDLAQVILAEMEKALPGDTSLSVNLADLDPAYAKRVPPQ